MKIEDCMLYMVENYISNEIECVASQIKIDNMKEYREEYKKDLEYLESLTLDDMINITNLCFDEELMQKLYDNINYYLYHYKITKEETK